MEQVSGNRSHGGTQGVYTHQCPSTGTPTTFAVFVPDHTSGKTLPVLWYLSGLPCTHANVTEKGEFRAACAKHGIILVTPDTSPRGDEVPDDEAYDFGKGASFYVDAAEEPWSRNLRLSEYIERELPAVVAAELPVDMGRQGITAHSMGGHGALTISLRNPGRSRSTSAFSPIVSSLNCPWGEALMGCMGADRAAWRAYDACALLEDGARLPVLLIDQGEADNSLFEQLKTNLLQEACERGGQSAKIRTQPSYDHSYYLISTFMADHIVWHEARH